VFIKLLAAFVKLFQPQALIHEKAKKRLSSAAALASSLSQRHACAGCAGERAQGFLKFVSRKHPARSIFHRLDCNLLIHL